MLSIVGGDALYARVCAAPAPARQLAVQPASFYLQQSVRVCTDYLLSLFFCLLGAFFTLVVNSKWMVNVPKSASARIYLELLVRNKTTISCFNLFHFV